MPLAVAFKARENSTKKIFWFPRKDFQFCLAESFGLVTVHGECQKT
jgi:hypothetical protein